MEKNILGWANGTCLKETNAPSRAQAPAWERKDSSGPRFTTELKSTPRPDFALAPRPGPLPMLPPDR